MKSLSTDSGRTDIVADRVRLAYELLLNRRATSADVTRWKQFLDQRRELSAVAKISADVAESDAWESLVRVLLSSNTFMYVR